MQVMIVPFKRYGKVIYCPFHCGIRNFSYQRLAPVNKRDFWRFIVKFLRHYNYEPKKLISWSKFDICELLIKLKCCPSDDGNVYVLTCDDHNVEYEIVYDRGFVIDRNSMNEIEKLFENLNI